MQIVFDQELAKEVIANRRTMGEVSRVNLAYECADVQILLMLFARHNGVDLLRMCQAKMEINFDRKWKADPDGVLWQPTKQGD